MTKRARTFGRFLALGSALLLGSVLGAPAAAPIGWTEHTVTAVYHHDPYSIKAMDMNRDGAMDFVTGATYFGYGMLSWWENDRGQRFTEHQISGDGNFWWVHPVDMDKDGDPDILVIRDSEGPPYKVTLFVNDGNMAFSPLDLYSDMAIDLLPTGPADLDRDGDLDIVGFHHPQTLVWLENVGGLVFQERIIDVGTGDGSFIDVAVGDVDGDCGLDIVTTARGGTTTPPELFWWKNNGDQTFQKNLIRDYAGLSVNPGRITIADVNRDGRQDLVLGAVQWSIQGWLSWFENTSSSFSEHVIATDLVEQNHGEVVDMDGDGDMDIMHDHYRWPGWVRWFENDGTQNFTAHVISDTFEGAHCEVVDLDGDSDLDVIGAAFFNDDITWWESNRAVFPLGGSATRLALPIRVQCKNQTTGQTVKFSEAEGSAVWDCEAAGLVVNPGDRVTMSVSGQAN